MMQLLWKTIWRVLKKLKIALPYDSVISFLGIYPKELKSGSQGEINSQVHCSLIHNSQDIETNFILTSRRHRETERDIWQRETLSSHSGSTRSSFWNTFHTIVHEPWFWEDSPLRKIVTSDNKSNFQIRQLTVFVFNAYVSYLITVKLDL